MSALSAERYQTNGTSGARRRLLRLPPSRAAPCRSSELRPVPYLQTLRPVSYQGVQGSGFRVPGSGFRVQG